MILESPIEKWAIWTDFECQFIPPSLLGHSVISLKIYVFDFWKYFTINIFFKAQICVHQVKNMVSAKDFTMARIAVQISNFYRGGESAILTKNVSLISDIITSYHP